MAPKRIGILTGGGDVPGLNSVIKEVVYRASENQCSCCIRRGRSDSSQPEDPASRACYVLPLDCINTRTIDRTGGTILHSSRTNPSKMKKVAPFLSADSFPKKEGSKGTTYDVALGAQKSANLEKLDWIT